VLFNSFSFLACFAALVVVYYAIPHRRRWALLLVASLAYYATFSAAYVVLLAGVTLVTYVAGLSLGNASDRRVRNAILASGAGAVLAALAVFKYPGPGIAAIAGLSFYSFSCVSYLADVHGGRLPPVRHIGRFALYVAFFPKLLAGPIERARPFLAQITQAAHFSPGGVTLGLQLVLWGLFKKVVIADRLAPFVERAYGQPSLAPAADLVLATYFFAFQLYCDFSGYSDIAIGSAKVLGFDLMENFRRPYFSTSMREFWSQRWHLSLASWFRDYRYVPLGGSRVPRARHVLNVMAVFMASGIWHGANWTFVVWGGLNGLFTVMSTALTGTNMPRGFIARVLGAVVTFHLVLITWVFFRADTLADAITILTRVAGSAATVVPLTVVRLQTGDVMLSVLLIAVLLGIEGFDEVRPVWSRLTAWPLPLRWAAYYALILSLIVLGTWNLEQFVYLRF